MSQFTPQIVPLGSLAEAAAASSEVAQQEQSLYAAFPGDPGTTCGLYLANP
jgi:hypothetical protein